MRLVLGLAALLAATVVQPAGAWIPIGKTADTGGILVYTIGTDVRAETYDPTSANGLPAFTWYYPTEVQAALGGGPYFFSANGTGGVQSGNWVGNAGLQYDGQNLPAYLIFGSVQSLSYQSVGQGQYSFEAFGLVNPAVVTLPDGTTKPLSDFGITNQLKVTGTLTAVPGQWPDDGMFFRGPMVLSVQPVPEPVFFQMGALMGLSGLGLLRLRRKA